jgi:dTDP-4-amino-4,6-dideoxygalactose transaminase
MVPFHDLSREYKEIYKEIEIIFKDICQKGWFVLGEHVEDFEKKFAAYIGNGTYAVSVGSGTEALHISLVASGIEYGDYVITVPNTAVPTVSAISFAGAIPLFVDIDARSYTLDTSFLKDVVKKEKNRLGKKLKAIIPVHIYGQSADMDPILEIAKEFEITVIEDACQSHGAEYKGKKVGLMGDYAAFSFYPSKNLGAYGDGGIIITQNEEKARNLNMLRNYGQEKRYYHKIKGFNSRLDELQAAVLIVKLKYLDKWNKCRKEIADYYTKHINNPLISKPIEMSYGKHVFHLYVIRHPHRDIFTSYLNQKGINTLIHYPVPVHLQEAYSEFNYLKGSFPVAERFSKEIISIPIFPQLRKDEIEKIVDLINTYN